MMSFGPVGRQFPPYPGLFLTTILACVAGVAASYLFFVWTTSGQYLDQSALEQARLLPLNLKSLTRGFLGVLPVLSVIIAALVVFFVALFRKRWRSAGVTVLAMIAANITAQLVKSALPDRPLRGVRTELVNSFPSGHATIAAACAAAIFLAVSPRWRPFAAFVGSSFAIIAGIATLVSQWHRPSDVISAYLVVSAWAAAAGWVNYRIDPEANAWPYSPRNSRVPWTASNFWSGFMILVGIIAAVAVIAGVTLINSDVFSLNYLWVGFSLMICTGYLIAVVGIKLFTAQSRNTDPQPQQETDHYAYA